MPSPIRWRHDRPTTRRRQKTDPRPLRVIKSALGEMARLALAEPFMLSIERQEIFLRRLPKALDGLRVVHLSDFHYGPLTDSRHLERAVKTANDLRPDLIALTGDYISQDRVYAAPCAELIGATFHEVRNNAARPTGTIADNFPRFLSIRQSAGIKPPNRVLSKASEIFGCTRIKAKEPTKRSRT